jgi:hypothetical protein
VSGEDARQPRITLAKPKNQQNNQAQARGRVLFIFQNQIDARNQTVFNELDQAVKHAGFAGKMAIQRGLRDADGSRQFRGGNTLTTIAGFQHQRQRLKYFFATIPFRSLLFCHVLKYP